MPILHDGVILVVEDDEPKLNAITSNLQELAASAQIVTASSVASAVDVISSRKIDVAVLDMSLPAFDINGDVAGGGQPQGFGGRDILRFLEDCWPDARAVVLTQYEEFKPIDAVDSKQDLASMAIELNEEFSEILLGVIYYSGQRGNWRDKMRVLLNGSGL